uniref:Uncharacterized protein n=1 Tax=Anguilla anguilla TaxID=7936 RepID=A0A0E9W8U2_ANGAN
MGLVNTWMKDLGLIKLLLEVVWLGQWG